MPIYSIDAIDQRILSELQADGRITNHDLAGRVGLSPSPCLRRVRQLEEAGVIQRYVGLVDPAALGLQDKLMPLHQHLFVETNPAPAKYALSVLGKMSDDVRLPMVPLSDKSKAVVRDAMVHAGLIN